MSAYNDQKLDEYRSAYDDLFARYLQLETQYRVEAQISESLTTIVRLLIGKGLSRLTTDEALETRDILQRLAHGRDS